MDDLEFRQRLLREALAVLALPRDEQIRVNGPGPGCLACDLLNDFDHARAVALENDAAILSEEQRNLLERISAVMDTMESSDFECFNKDVVQRPVWQDLRVLAASALQSFGWETTAVGPFVEIEPGVWQRPTAAPPSGRNESPDTFFK